MGDPAADVGAFAARVLRRPLWPHQLEAARSPAFITTVAAARRTGKTTTIETLAIWTAFREAGVTVVILSATQDAARRVTEAIGATLASLGPTRGAVVDDFATRIRLTNGSEIVSLPASQRQVRGYGRGVKLLVIDEAGFVEDDLWRAARYIALDERQHGSRIVLCGTPWGGAEHFFRAAYERGRDGDPEHSSHHWTYEANPNLDRGYLERERERTAPAEYAAEVLGEWSDAAGSFFPRALLEAATADLELPALAELAPPARLLLGVDWGVSFDQSAAVAIARLPVGPWNPGLDPARAVFGVAAVQLWPQGTPLNQVAGEVAGSRGEWAIYSPEETGVGAGPSQELRRLMRERTTRRQRPLEGLPAWHDVPSPTANPVATTAAKKAAAYGAVRYLLEEGRLVLPRHPELLRQLAGLRFEVGDRGHMRIEAEQPAVHDDVADALMLAAGPYSQRGAGGRAQLVVALQDLAARRTPEAQLPGHAGDLETCATGAGLRLPGRPFLQSVAGGEITPPPAGGQNWAQASAGGPRFPPEILAAQRAIAAARRDREERNQWR